MEIVSSLVILAALTLLVGIVLLLCGGIAALFGVNFVMFMKYSSWLLLLPVAVFAYGWIIERNCFKISNVDIVSEAVPESFEGYRIVHISDIHLRSFEHRRRALQRVVDKINDLSPDIIIFSGDLVTLSVDEILPLKDILSRLEAPEGVYSVMGNHDYLVYDRKLTPEMRLQNITRLKEMQAEMGWNMLDNQCVNLSRGQHDCISLIGIENLSEQGYFPSYGDIDKASSGACGQFRILVSHDPSAWEKHIVGKTDIDLTLSGHTHDMQSSLFGMSPSAILYKQHRGLYLSEKDTACGMHRQQYLYVNIGLGETIFPARIGAPGEITLITLRSQNQDSSVRR